MEAKEWEVLPFPLVPATWMDLNFFSGCPRWAHNEMVLLKSFLKAVAPTLWNMGNALNR